MPIVKRAKGQTIQVLNARSRGGREKRAADEGAGSVARLAALSPSSDFFIFARARGACW